MAKYNTLFPVKYLQDRLGVNLLTIENLKEKLAVVGRWKNEIDTKSIYTKKEEQLQSDFLNDIFGKVLGYAYERGLAELNLEKEYKSKTDGTKPDGVLGYLTAENKDIRVVIELKDAYTNLDHKQNRKNDNRTPVEQAFSYVSKCGGKCKWVIVSNFVEIRFYPANDSSVYQSFFITDLAKEEKLKEFYALLAKDHLFIPVGNSKVDDLLKVKIEADENITNEFYGVYKNLRSQLFKHIKENNPSIDENTILTKSQKILDRIIFICFCEDLGLLPYKVFKEILHQTQTARFIMTDTRLWEEIKGLFTAIDQGYPQENINRFNGGLFKADDVIDNLVIRDSILEEILSIERYSFDSDLNVNILGHIFEQSITDLEELKSVINGENFDKKKGKRKKDGVFYTPEYITKYIVNEAVGSWLEDKKKELGYYELPKIDDEQWRRIKTGKVQKNNKTIKAHLNFWLEYRKALDNIKVLDPACGSGSFLVQVFDYLKQQRSQVNDEIATFEGTQAELFNQDTHILSHNIYGVDLNAESVEITKLALWLKTANKKDPLTALDDNIKCGNSLIDDVAVAGDKAFDWNKEFPEIMQNGGFDVIVGNPPYVPTEYITTNQKIYYEKKYQSAFGRLNLYPLFYEKAINLLKINGYLGYINPYTLLKNKYFVESRKYIIDNTSIRTLVDFSSRRIFNSAAVDTIILILKKQLDLNSEFIYIDDINDFVSMDYNTTKIKQTSLKKTSDISFNKPNAVLKKIFLNTEKLKNIIEFKQGIITGNNKAFIINSETAETKKVLRGEDFNRYTLSWNSLYVKYNNNLHRPRTPDVFELPEKILVRQTGNYPIAMIDNNSYYTLDTVHNGKIINSQFTSQYLIALLNSKAMKYIWNCVINEEKKAFGQIKIIYLNELPIPKTKQIKQKEVGILVITMLQKNKEIQDKSNHFLDLLKAEYEISELSNKLLYWYEMNWKQFTNELKKQKIILSASQKDDWFERFTRISGEIKTVQQTISATDQQIDTLIYQLYGLTNEEIKVVENG